MQISDKVFVVTGAGSGLGAAVTEMIVGAGGKVVMVDLNPSALEATAARYVGSVCVQTADVTSEEDAQQVIATAKSVFGRIDGLVNCAGVAPSEKILGRKGVHRLDSFAKVMTVNLIGTFNMLRLCAEVIATQSPDESGERGVIINTASVAGYDGQIGQTAYAASKGGVISLTLPAARELAAHGIRVVAIAPGIFGTPMLLSMPQPVQDALGASVPFPSRLGQPAEFAALVRHVLENQMLNGEVIRLDGALRMTAK